VKGIDGATDLLGGGGNGKLGLKNQVNGLLFDFGGKIGAGHGDGNEYRNYTIENVEK